MSPEMSITGDDFIRLGLWEVGEKSNTKLHQHPYIHSELHKRIKTLLSALHIFQSHNKFSSKDILSVARWAYLGLVSIPIRQKVFLPFTNTRRWSFRSAAIPDMCKCTGIVRIWLSNLQRHHHVDFHTNGDATAVTTDTEDQRLHQIRAPLKWSEQMAVCCWEVIQTEWFNIRL